MPLEHRRLDLSTSATHGLSNLAGLFCLGLALFTLNPAVAEEWVKVRPADTGEALVNPGMGWTLHFYSNFIENYGSKLEPVRYARRLARPLRGLSAGAMGIP